MQGIRPLAAGIVFTLAGVTCASADPLAAQSSGQTTPPAQAQGQAQTQSQTQPPPDLTYKETVIVSASKTEQQLVDAPVTLTVIGARALTVAPSNNYGDLLRNVPGVNITQISARDVNVTNRAASSSLATSQLTVLDGRSLYQDFFGFTMWDFMPANLDEIKRIEVIRGPASAVWGANALTGVINVITKTPREMAGSSFAFGVGSFGRDVGATEAAAGSLFYVRGTHAQALNDRWAYKVSAGTYTSEALARPTGLIPNSTGTSYPPYANAGTSQPKFDARFDYDFPDGERKLRISAGLAGTDGIMHSGIGPFDIDTGTKMGYGKVDFTRRAFKLQVFTNVLDGDATNLLSADEAGVPIGLRFETKTFDVEVGDTRVFQAKHVVTYGGNLRVNRFNLTIAPGENGRTEGGAYVQDELLASERFRVVAGARIDKFSSIENPVFSPRVAVVFKPRSDQSVRASYNRAFRAPSMVNNNLDITISTVLPLGQVNPAFGSAIFRVPTDAVGNPDLTEEAIDAFEISYTGNVRDRATVSAAWYYSKFTKQIFFTQTGIWTTPPPGFPGLGPFPPAAIWAGLMNAGVIFPSEFTYRNLGEVRSQGLELGVDASITSAVHGYINYAFQPEPKPTFPGLTDAQALAEINRPSEHLVNAGVSCMTSRGFGTISVSRAGRAFWQDVLDSRFHGFTKAYTTVNLTLGTKWGAGKYTASLRVTNIGNEQIQQHVFADIVRRQIVGEFKVNLQ
jgi:iron complex outermembrane receptor protein